MKSGKCKALFERLDELEKEYMGVDRVGAYFSTKAGQRGWKVEVQKQPISGGLFQ